MTFHSLKNQFLIAMPGLPDPNFQQTVTYICEHHENGAMGIVINQPVSLTMKELLSHLDLDVHESVSEDPLYYGGPVQKERGFLLHSSEQKWETTMCISEGISLTGSKDILEAIAHNKGPKKVIMALGYAGWDAGQLESELAANSWLTVPAEPSILFDIDSDKRWTTAAGKLGIDVNLVSGQTKTTLN